MSKIGIDIFGGDNSPEATIEAAQKYAADHPKTEVFMFGKEEIITKMIDESLENIIVVNATEKIDGNDEPSRAIRRKKDSSIVVGAKYLAEGKIDAFVSAGNTGALIAAGIFIVKRIPGIDRPCLASLMPSTSKKRPTLLLDLGANVETKVEHLHQYAKIGSVYMEKVFDIESASVGLINVGTEENKGNTLYKETHQVLKNDDSINFAGNVEAREILNSTTDVIVMDGFTGNMIIKSIEGAASFFGKTLKRAFMSNIITKLSALGVKGKLKAEMSKLDYEEIGGSQILGINKIIIKAHGSSDSKAFYNAMRQAQDSIDAKYIEKIKEEVKTNE